MEKEDLRKRTKEFALKMLNLCVNLPKNPQVQIIGKQLLRSGTSVGANYREGFRARSKQEFISKLGICLQELEETVYWMELLEDGRLCPKEKSIDIKDEAEQLIRIFVASLRKLKASKNS